MGNVLPEPFYNTLALFPAFADEPKIRTLLRKGLEDPHLANRMQAARMLVWAGDPEGILHLTYNSLSFHPLLRVKNDLLSLWPEAYLLREADKLNEVCIDLLIGDLKPPHAFWHMDILAALPAEKIVPRMLTLLKGEPFQAMLAAYVLAMKANPEGKGLLLGLVEKQKFLNLALVALSHLPDFVVTSHLRSYASPEHSIYNRDYENIKPTDAQRSGLQLQASCRNALLENKNPHPLRDTIDAFYLTSIQHMVADSDLRTSLGRSAGGAGRTVQMGTFEDLAEAAWRWIKPPRSVGYRLYTINSGIGATMGQLATGVSAPDFLCEFSTPQDRDYCAEIQRTSIRALIQVIGWRTLGNGSDMGIRTTFMSGQDLPPSGVELAWRNKQAYLPGVAIEYEPRDYERAAVEWILHPQRYRTQSYWPWIMLQ